MKSLVILISGRGSNMVRIAQRCQQESWLARITCVISNRPDAPGLQTAAEMGLPTEVLDHKGFESRDAFDSALADRIENYQPDLVALAGFMRILGERFVQRFHGRLVNVHPSLLPAFPGLNTHERALDAGVKLHGATVHYVIPELDAGPVIAQAAVPVRDDDTAPLLMQRVQAAEHVLYPAAVHWLLNDQVTLRGDRTFFEQAACDSAAPATDQQPAMVFLDPDFGR